MAGRAATVAGLVTSMLAIGPNTYAGLVLAARRMDPTAILRHQLGAVTVSDYAAEIRKALDDGDPEMARSLADLAASYGHTLDPVLLKEVQDAGNFSAARSAEEVFDGAVNGKTHTTLGLAASVLTGISPVGDFRDLRDEAFKFPGCDWGVVALATAGVAVSAAGWFGTATGVGAAPSIAAGTSVKQGLNLLKGAKRMGFLRPRLLGQLAREGREVIDMSQVKRVFDEFSFLEVRKAGNGLLKTVRRDKVDGLMELAGSAGALTKAQSVRGVRETLERVDDLHDLPKYEALSAKLGTTYRGSLRLAGKVRWSMRVGEILQDVLAAILRSAWFLASMAFALVRAVLGLATAITKRMTAGAAGWGMN